MKITVRDILEATRGRLMNGKKNATLSSVSTDTRLLKKGDFYIALKGPRFDGHDFLADAQGKGASGALIMDEKKAAALEPGVPLALVAVKDTLYSLGEIARWCRTQANIPVIGITGSSGKTTTKNLLGAMLAVNGPTLITEGNLNNLIGLPLTLLRLEKKHRFAVCEMGMNVPGEIARLSEIARPTHGLITNVGPAHLEGLGSLEGIAKAKEELFASLGPDAYALVNVDDRFISSMKTRAKKKTYGLGQKADFTVAQFVIGNGKTHMEISENGKIHSFAIPLIGHHHMQNSLAAIACARILGLTNKEIQKGLDVFRLDANRGQEIISKTGTLIINDTYNANPQSIEAAAKALRMQYPQRRAIAVLGDMHELGREAARLHMDAGRQIKKNGFAALYALGNYAPDYATGFGQNAFPFSTLEALASQLSKDLEAHDVVLVKGSRLSRMERVIERLK